MLLTALPLAHAQENSKITFDKIFQGNTTVLGRTIQYPRTKLPQIIFWRVTLPPHSVGDWHKHLVPEFFYVEHGKLYVTNKQKNGRQDVTKFDKGQVGLTDINVPQFIWNPTEEVVTVIAIYFGEKGKESTKKLGGKPSSEMLSKLISGNLTENKTETNNEASIKRL